ncbi:MAG TPA: ABC transporter ATP-binding protein [Candidatus Acidoferrales bacterium]|nr:ABC transporter ATP-binding protein [Candidatus Acidoferrales bacterium]
MRQLSKAFGSQWALRDVSFDLRAGECVALLGQNGAGKTTLLKLLSALMRPTSGAIELARPAVGYLVPGAHLYEHLTVGENLRLFLALHNNKKTPAEVEKALSRASLTGAQDWLVSALSAGMKCRLLIAKWLLVEPGLLLLDEPYGPLDGAGVDLLESFVSELTRAQTAVIIATHQIPRALALCSRALVLTRGRLVFDGPRDDAAANLDRLGESLLPRGEAWSY